jgi:hypothetical protein
MTPQGKKKGRLALVLGILAGLLVSLLFLLQLCRTTGLEFSPARFQTRQFYLYRIPGTDLQFLPTFQSSMPNDTPSAILKDLRTYDSNDTWHMLKADSRGGESFPANLLVTSLMRLNVENQPYWGAWSSKQPGYAATLWPIIQAMAMSNLYHEIPEVLRFAEGYTGPEQVADAPCQGECEPTAHGNSGYWSNYLAVAQVGASAAGDRKRHE